MVFEWNRVSECGTAHSVNWRGVHSLCDVSLQPRRRRDEYCQWQYLRCRPRRPYNIRVPNGYLEEFNIFRMVVERVCRIVIGSFHAKLWLGRPSRVCWGRCAAKLDVSVPNRRRIGRILRCHDL